MVAEQGFPEVAEKVFEVYGIKHMTVKEKSMEAAILRAKDMEKAGYTIQSIGDLAVMGSCVACEKLILENEEYSMDVEGEYIHTEDCPDA